MDSITHVFLGAAIAQIAVARRVGFGRAFLIGALAATVPDFDVFIYTGDAVRDHAFHRQCMHALMLVPALAFLSVLPFMFFSRTSRPHWKALFFAAMLACASHTVLDALTSYGTMIFWPFSERRYALDIIAVVDPIYTLPLIFGACLAWKRRLVRPAMIAFVLSLLYLGFATFQHARAQMAQRDLLAFRHVTAPENPRVLPQVGAVVVYRSIYKDRGMIHADAIRVPFFSAPTVKAGGAIPLLTAENLNPPLAAAAPRDFALFSDLADGFLARSPKDPILIADERYTYVPEGFEPVWGIQLERTTIPLFRITPRWNYVGKLAGDLFRPAGYISIPAVAHP